MNPRGARWFLAVFLLALTGLRIWMLPQTELSPDEAYYAEWSRHLDWAYYSKGPGVAATIWLGTELFGYNALGVRFFSPLLALGTSVLIWLLARRIFNESVAFWSVMIGACLPIFWAGSLLMTIDPLSIVFWSAALLTLWFALEKAPAFTFWWFLSGLLIGLGFLCKYTNAMQLLSVVILLVVSRRLRGELRRPGFWSMLIGFLATSWPPILWNLNHDWITLAHLKARGGIGSDFRINPGELLEFLVLHLGVYSPLILIGFVIAAWHACRASRGNVKYKFLLSFALPLLLMYLILSLNEAGEANWTAPAFISLTVLGAAFWIDRVMVSRAAAVFSGAALLIGLLLSTAVLNTDLVRSAGLEWPYRKDPSGRLRGWRTAAATVQEFRRNAEEQLGEKVFLIANRYQTAAELGFYLPERRMEGPNHPPVYIPESQNLENQYSFWPRYDEFVELPKEAAPVDPMFVKEGNAVNQFVGRNALFVTDNTEGIPPTEILRAFEKVVATGEYDVFRRGQLVKRWRVFLCWNYNTLPL